MAAIDFLQGCGGVQAEDSIQAISVVFSYSGTATLDTECDGVTPGSRESSFSMTGSKTFAKLVGCTTPASIDQEAGEFCSRKSGCCARVALTAIGDNVGTWSDSNECGGACSSDGGDLGISFSNTTLFVADPETEFEIRGQISFSGGTIGRPGCIYCTDQGSAGGIFAWNFVIGPINWTNLFGAHNLTEVFSGEPSGPNCVFSSTFSITVTIA